MRSISCVGDRTPIRSQRGATVVEFLGVTVLVAIALMVVIQFSLWVWTRDVVVNAADEGARTAAEAGRSLSDGEARVPMDGGGEIVVRTTVDAKSGRATLDFTDSA